jgi:hypothetical protein
MKMSLKMICGLVLLVSFATGCTKHIDPRLQLPPGTINNTPSSAGSVRLLNLSHRGHFIPNDPATTPYLNSMDVTLNGRQLTNFTSPSGFTGATPWFVQGKLTYGNQYVFPDSLFDPQGNGDLQLYYVPSKRNASAGLILDSLALQFELQVHNNPNAPEDIYIYDQYTAPPAISGSASFTDAILRTPKAATPSGDPSRIRIRVLNLAAKNSPGPYDRISLLFADGSSVDAKLKNVVYQQVSDYIELPYGNYAFKLTDQAGDIIGEIGDGVSLPQNHLHFFQPGGVYTIVTTWSYYNGDINVIGSDVPGYTITQDIAPPMNPNYIKIQGVDALPGHSNIHFTVDGQPLGSFLQPGQSSVQGIYSVGPHRIQVLDNDGSLLAEQLLDDTQPLNNLTAWVYGKAGAVVLLVLSNDMSMSQLPAQVLSPDPPRLVSLTNGWISRFLNLSDVPFVSFMDTAGNYGLGAGGSSNDSNACMHVGIGTVLLDRPTIGFGIGTVLIPSGLQPGATVIAYDSPPGVTPGTRLTSIDHPFIANPVFYNGGYLPAAETGVYSVALIGTRSGGLRLITIRHSL